MRLAEQKRSKQIHAVIDAYGFTACGKWTGARAKWRKHEGRPSEVSCGGCLHVLKAKARVAA